MHSVMWFDDAVTDLRIDVEAERPRVVAVIQKECNLVSVKIFQILSRRLEVDVPRTACIGRVSSRNDLGGYRARRFEREIGSIGRTPDMMRDVTGDRVGKDKAGDKAATALKNCDTESGRDEIVGAVLASALAQVGDVEAHVENISIRDRVVNDLDGG